jgi:OmpR family response regulator RpaB
VFDNVISCIKGLELGADDYLIKPFSLKELEARITVLLRFPAQEVGQLASSASVLKIGELTIDLLKNKIIKNGISIALTPIEFTLFTFLVENAGRSLSRIKILENVWGYTPVRDVDTRVVDVYIFRLRVKIEKTPKKPDYILTVQGKGYMFQSFLLK